MNAPRVRLRPEIESMVPYKQGKPAAADAFKLSSNENPFDPLPAVLEAITTASVNINRYPDATAALLRERIGSRFGVSPECVQVGSGSVAILAQLITAAAAPGDEVVYSWRSFEAYPLLTMVAGATSVPVANTADHKHDLHAIAAAVTEKTRLIIVCSPNNPTGTIVTDSEFRDFMALVPPTVLVILDEAYVEFVTDDQSVNGATVLHDYSNLVVLRTFSKAYGLAGLRVGYAVGPEYIMNAAKATALPLSVTGAAQQAALVSLDHESELLDRVASIAEFRDTLWSALVTQGWDTPRSHGNFVWLPTGEHTQWAAQVFLEHGIVARAYGQDGVRVSVGEAESVDKLLSAAAEVVTKLLSVTAEATLD